MSRFSAYHVPELLRLALCRLGRRRVVSSLPILVAALLACFAHEGGAQEDDAQQRMSYGADTARRRLTPAGLIFYGEGNAFFNRGDLRVSADLFRYYEQARFAWLVGNVHAVTESLELWADSARVDEGSGISNAYSNVKIRTHDGVLGIGDRGIYWRIEENMALIGNARIIDGEVTLEGDSLYFDRQGDIVEAFGGVKVVDGKAQTVVTGEHGVMERSSGYAYVDSVPQLSSRRRDGSTAVVGSRWMSFQKDGVGSRAVGDVLFRQGQTIAHADTADFIGEEELVLRGSPQVEQGSQLMSGEEIRFQYVEGKLDRIEVFGGAVLVDSTPDTLASAFTGIPLANELKGDTLIIDMKEGEISRTRVWGNASSVYLPEDQTDILSVNEATGDSLEITFREGQVDRVSIMGNSQGTYRFLEREKVDRIVSNADSLLIQREARLDSLAAAAGVSLDSLELEEESIEPAYSGGRLDFSRTADTVEYSGGETTFRVSAGQIHISQSAQVTHGTMSLLSEDIYFDTDERELLAEGDPMIIDASSKLVGDKMGYLFDYETGAVASGVTAYEDGFYYGDHVRRIDDETLLVNGGAFTSCDLADPHYHFRAKRMKLKVGESVVARQVTVYVSDLPVFVFPFFFKKIDSGRHSGIIFPNVNLGFSSRAGRYIRDMGYYWATNEYTDFTFKGAYNESRDLSLQIRNRYVKRYGFSGGAEFTWTTALADNQRGDEWTFRANHRQPDLLDVWNLTADANLTSNSITNVDPITGNSNDLLPTQLRSNLALSRNFDSGARLNLTGQHTQYVNAEDDDPLTDNLLFRQNLPGVTLSFRTMPLLSAARRQGEGGALKQFLRDMTFSQSYRGDANQVETENSKVGTQNLSGSWGLSYNPQYRLGIFNFTSNSSFGAAYNRVDENSVIYALGDTLRDGNGDPVFDENGEALFNYDIANQVDGVDGETTPNFSWRNSLTTNLYGLFDTHIGPLRGIKHKLSFAASHQWRPELAGGKQPESQSVALRMGNELSFKYATKPSKRRDEALKTGETRSGGYIPPAERTLEEGDNGEEIRKLDRLITWDLTTSYNPNELSGKNWTDIGSVVRLSPGFTRAFDLSMNNVIDPYNFEVLRTEVNTNLRVNGAIDFGGELLERQELRNPIVERVGEPALSDSTDQSRQDPWYTGVERPELTRSGNDNTMPWSFSTRASVTNTRDAGTRATISLSAEALLPISWKITYGSNFDIESGDFTNQQFSLSRDIHCWRIEFRRSVTNATDFSFRIYLKGLPDIEYKRGDASLGGYFDRFGSY